MRRELQKSGKIIIIFDFTPTDFFLNVCSIQLQLTPSGITCCKFPLEPQLALSSNYFHIYTYKYTCLQQQRQVLGLLQDFGTWLQVFVLATRA